jgi:hypothetical protein
MESRSTVGERMRAFISRVNGLNLGMAGVTLSSEQSRGAPSALSLRRECVEALEKVPLIVISIDDAEELDQSGLGALKTIDEAHSQTPILLIVTGGVEFSDRLNQTEASPVARVFSGSKFDVGELSQAETEDALNAPLVATAPNTRWEPSGVAAVQTLSHGYPYLVQCLAYSAFAENTSIDADRVLQTLEAALDVASSWLQRECDSASDVDIIAFAKIASTGKPIIRNSEIRKLDIQSPYIGRLVVAAILLKISRGHYELRKAPVIAYYHVHRRRLTFANPDPPQEDDRPLPVPAAAPPSNVPDAGGAPASAARPELDEVRPWAGERSNSAWGGGSRARIPRQKIRAPLEVSSQVEFGPPGVSAGYPAAVAGARSHVVENQSIVGMPPQIPRVFPVPPNITISARSAS